MSGSGNGRKRSSKWDSRDQSQFDDERIQDDVWSEKSGRPYYHREGGRGWQSPELGGSNGSKWSTLESNDPRSKHDNAVPAKEPFSGTRGSHKNEKFDKDRNKYAEDSMAWEEDIDYDTRMSPGLNEWRHQSHSQSPKSGWNNRRLELFCNFFFPNHCLIYYSYF